MSNFYIFMLNYFHLSKSVIFIYLFLSLNILIFLIFTKHSETQITPKTPRMERNAKSFDYSEETNAPLLVGRSSLDALRL